MKEKMKNFSVNERQIADEVADEILTVHEEDDDRRYFLLLLFFLICLIFLVSSISFAIFKTYYNGVGSNAIDVGVDVDVNKCTRNCDTDGDGICDKFCDKKERKNKNKDKDDDKNVPIYPGTVLFSYNEGSNYIDMVDVFPTLDSVGKTFSGDKEYFDFNISVALIKTKIPVTYEISAVPIDSNTIEEKDIRVYLTEEKKAVSINSNDVNTFSKLPDSKFNKNGKVLFKKTVSSNYNASYVFRMWLSSNATISKQTKKFGCKIVVNGYYNK